jgi:hypothetical protein
MSRVPSMLFLLVLLVGTIPVFAGNQNQNPDETVLITQSTVLDARGFPLKTTASGSYKLAGNLVVPANASGVLIQAKGVSPISISE